MKLFKRFLSVALSVMLIASTAVIASISAAASSGDTIYFEKPDGWDDTVYIYYWEGSPAPSGLYDYRLTQVSDNIYSYTCKAGFSKFLINDGQSGKHQTVDVDLKGDGYIVRVLSTGSTNGYGNFCNNVSVEKYDPEASIGVNVTASPKDSEFVGSLTVTLGVTETPTGKYSVNGSTPIEYTNGTKITVGENSQVGDVVTLTLTAGDVTKSFKYTKVSTPSAASMVYFDNSKFNFDEVYIYAYGTKENAEWPGEKMQKGDDGLYYYGFSSAFANENIIINNGKEDEEKIQFPKNSGLPLKSGECKLLTAENEWVGYGTPDSKPAGFAYTSSGTAFTGDALNVKIGLKNAVKGTYQVDGGTVFEYTGDTVVSVGQGAIGNKDITLTLTATNDKGVLTSADYTYRKSFKPSKTTFSAESDGHKSEAVGGYYGTNPNMQLGKNKTISVDGDPSDWDSSMIIAQGVANDDPRVYMPSAMHEQPWDDYALYAAWDNDNLYFMWEMANTTYVVSPSDDFAASQEARPWRNSIPIFLALSINPEIHADGTAWGTDKTGKPFTNPFVWGADGGAAKDGGVKFTTNVDTLIAFDTNNSNGGSSIFKADRYDAVNDNYMFNYDTAIPIGVTSFEKQDNRNGFKIAHDYGTLSENIYGVGGAKGSHTVGDSLLDTSDWVDFFDLGYKQEHGFIYEVAVPLSTLGITKQHLESNGIGVMQILTYGTSGMDCLPYDKTMQDNADVEYSYDPSTSHEKEDIDDITVPLARVGALLPDTVINKAPLEVNFGADKAGTQGIGASLTLKAEAYNAKGDCNYTFSVNGSEVQSSAKDSYTFTPDAKGTYELSVTVTDGSNSVTKQTSINIGDEPVKVTQPPETQPLTNPRETETLSPNPSETSTVEPTETQDVSSTEPYESTSPEPSEPQSDTQQPTGSDPSDDPTGTAPDATGDTGSAPSTDPSDVQPTTQTEPQPTDATVPQSTEATETQLSTIPTGYPSGCNPYTKHPTLNKFSATMKAGSTLKLKVTGGSYKPSVTYKSSNKKIAKVSKTGKVTALKKGKVTITAYYGSVIASCKIKVTSSPKAKINNKAFKAKNVYNIKKGKTLKVKLTGKASINNKYKSTDKKTAKVISKKNAKTVKIKGLRKGKATVKITVNGVVSFKIKVKVV